MNPIRKSNITALALGAAVFLSTSLLAKPPAQNYPEYPQNDVPVATQTQQQQQTVTTQTVTTVQQAPVQTVQPQPAPQPPPDVNCCAGCSVTTRFASNLVTVEKFLVSAPGMTGADVQYKVRTTANVAVSNVTLTENLPDGVTFQSAEPDVTRGGGNSLTWGYPQMQRGDVKEVLITVRPMQDGTFTANTKVCVDPAVCIAFSAGSPKLAIEKTGPTTADLGSQVSFTVKVSNVGTATAQNVVIVDNLPDGLKGVESQQPTYNIGNLAAGETRTVQVPVTAAQQGHWVNHACANSSNAATVCADAPIDVLLMKIQVTKTGPDRLFINREAPYTITVTNAGSAVLNNVTVTDSLPRGTQLLSVGGQAVTQNRSSVVWNIDSLQPGESKTDNLSLTSPEPGTTVNTVTATNGRVSDTASAQTIWEAPPGVLTEIADDPDPARVGSFITYTIRITNQGQWRDINTQIKVIFGDEVTPVDATDSSASISGKIVTVPDGILKPGATYTFRIRARADQAGLETTRLEFNSSFLPRPIDKDETTYIY